nr:immunoglobulin light chain junction region [Macaca mulatta]MOV98311.1 immunoglobulin light chain junction region [Macaca mulatta]MOW01818.1 immunoglobulin light chain junction region [Macaca mulatta]
DYYCQSYDSKLNDLLF